MNAVLPRYQTNCYSAQGTNRGRRTPLRYTGTPALDRLKKNGKTVISYTLFEKYGYFRIVKDLNEHYPKGMVSVRFDEHKPDQIRDWLYDDGNRRMTVYYPIMPIIIITTGE